MKTLRNAPGSDVIPFSRPFVTGQELENFAAALRSGHWIGGGPFTERCEAGLAALGLAHALLTTSCTDALEFAALLLDLERGDEVILPSYTFVSTANAFALRGATLRFADTYATHPNLDPLSVRALLTPRTRCIAVMHYGGVACDMDAIMALADPRGIAVVEDAAQAVGAFHRGRPLGTIGRFGTLSFHGTKNVAAGEGGALIMQRSEDVRRAEIIREKGTNRSAFIRGEVDKYAWVDLGSSFIPSDLLAAVLLAQLDAMEEIQRRRMAAWELYHAGLEDLEATGCFRRPVFPPYATNNAHVYYVVCERARDRDGLLDHLWERGIRATFHYTPLHSSPFQQKAGRVPDLPNTDRFHTCLVRLPLFPDLTGEQIERVVVAIRSYFEGN